jgi:dipeptidyl aminopeptidase/acylaminoacyl peptidase
MPELTPELIVDSLTIREIRINPDGSHLAFVVAPTGQPDPHAMSAIWITRTDSQSKPVKLTAGIARDHSPRWTSAGDALYFLSDRQNPGAFQIYCIALTGGEAKVVNNWETSVAAVHPVPGTPFLAFLASDPEPLAANQRKEARDDADVYGERWAPHRLRLLDVETQTVDTIDGLGDRHIAEVAPSPNGDQLAVLAWPTPEIDNAYRGAELLVVDVRSRTVRPVCQLPTGGEQLLWGGDSDNLVFLSHRFPDQRGGKSIYAVDAADGTSRRLGDGLAACPTRLAAAGRMSFVLIADGLDSWIGRVDFDSGQVHHETVLSGGAWELSCSTHGKTVAVARSFPNDRGNVWAANVGKPLRRLTDLNPQLSTVVWGQQERLVWNAPDGLEIQGLLILPVEAERGDGPFPLVTLVHGGPYRRYADTMQLDWNQWGQWLAAAGYAVFLPNPRGGLGRGHDFADRVAGAVGTDDWTDITAGIDQLVAKGIADPARLAIGGWSQGGFMTAWAVGQTNRFKAGIMGAGVSDWGMMVATSDLPHFEAMLGGSAGWEGPGPHRHDALSPISFSRNVTTPVLILHGVEDARVPVSQGRFFARALREHGVPCDLVVYPREGHNIRERQHQLDLLHRVRDWIERWLGSGHASDHRGRDHSPVAAAPAFVIQAS